MEVESHIPRDEVFALLQTLLRHPPAPDARASSADHDLEGALRGLSESFWTPLDADLRVKPLSAERYVTHSRSCSACRLMLIEEAARARPAAQQNREPITTLSNTDWSLVQQTPPLSDPLMVLRRIVVLLTVLPILSLGWAYSVQPDLAIWMAFTIGPAWLLGQVMFLAILPSAPCQALHLRSFRDEASSHQMLLDLVDGFGQMRFSGIRDPRRRHGMLLRSILQVGFACSYSRPGSMNLEAGHDWIRSLWRSLGEARCVTIDVTHLTDFVRQEATLALRTVGARRILFVHRGQQAPDAELRERLLALLAPGAESLHILCWSPFHRDAFVASVEAFVSQLPPGTNGWPESSYPSPTLHALGDEPINPNPAETWFGFAVGTLLAAVAATVNGDPRVWVPIVVVPIAAWTAFSILRHLWACHRHKRNALLFAFTALVIWQISLVRALM